MSNDMRQVYFNDNPIDIQISGEGFEGIYLNLAGEEKKLLKPGEENRVGGGRTNLIQTKHEVGTRPERNYYLKGDEEVTEFPAGAELVLAYAFILSGGSRVRSEDVIYIGLKEGGKSAEFVADENDPQR